MDSLIRKKGCKNSQSNSSQQRHTVPILRPRHSHFQLCRQRFKRPRHDGVVGGPYHRLRSVFHLPQPHIQRHQHRPCIRHHPQGHLPGYRRRLQLGSLRCHSEQLRQQLLQGSCGSTGASPIGPRALQQWCAGCVGQDL